ncbi:cadmium resistance transporter [Mycolicibacterium helvum]|uniref:Cadmium transporter n=1 Tax=Mycolicibacterium helvum TaxID=1534349 RepID=A0A7I7TCZ8_9MYCO|nr:cadmium resistance transporter [Mycolicibacterium helvum]BBY67112.1 cadmium transporter [Mycolicibacterium helvum]
MTAQAAVLFALTNIDDLVVLAVFFGRAGRHRVDQLRVVAGQYLGFCAILVVSVVGALGVSLLPRNVIPYLGLLPLFLGIRAGWQAWQARGADGADGEPPRRGPRVLEVATVTFANGGDNVGAYVPVFAVAGVGSMAGYIGTFLVGVAIWCAAGQYFASRPPVARLLSRWGHVILPVVLVAIGLAILIEGGAFGR